MRPEDAIFGERPLCHNHNTYLYGIYLTYTFRVFQRKCRQIRAAFRSRLRDEAIYVDELPKPRLLYMSNPNDDEGTIVKLIQTAYLVSEPFPRKEEKKKIAKGLSSSKIR